MRLIPSIGLAFGRLGFAVAFLFSFGLVCQAPAGRTSGNQSYQPARVVDVRTYGALGNGTTDDTTPLEFAARDARTQGLPLYFPTGQYKLTRPLDLTTGGAAEGRYVFGDGFQSTIVYYPPPNGVSSNIPPSVSGYGPFEAGALNLGNDGRRIILRDFRVLHGGSGSTNACGVKLYKVLQSTVSNVTAEGFACGIHLSNSWTDRLLDCKVSQCRYGILWDNVTIGQVQGCDISDCAVGIVSGWNIFGDNLAEPNSLTQGFSIEGNTLQACSAAAIVGVRSNVLNIRANYTEGNCGGSYGALHALGVPPSFDGCEVVVYSGHATGNSNVSIVGNWWWANQNPGQWFLGLNNCVGLTLANNSVYRATEWLSGPAAIHAWFEGAVSGITTDRLVKSEGPGIIGGANRLPGMKINSLPYHRLQDLSALITVPGGNQRTLLTAVESSCQHVNSVSITSGLTSLSGLQFQVGFYQAYADGFYQVFHGAVAAPAIDIARALVSLPLGTGVILPAGPVWVAIEVVGGPFSYKSAPGFDHSRGDRGTSVVAAGLGALSVVRSLQVGWVLPPAQLIVD